jgi:hypothetical protein
MAGFQVSTEVVGAASECEPFVTTGLRLRPSIHQTMSPASKAISAIMTSNELAASPMAVAMRAVIPITTH